MTFLRLTDWAAVCGVCVLAACGGGGADDTAGGTGAGAVGGSSTGASGKAGAGAGSSAGAGASAGGGGSGGSAGGGGSAGSGGSAGLSGGTGGAAGGGGSSGAGGSAGGGAGASGKGGASAGGSGGSGAGGTGAGASGAGGSGAGAGMGGAGLGGGAGMGGGGGMGGDAGSGGSAGAGGGSAGSAGAPASVRIYASFVSHNEQPPHVACSAVLANPMTFLAHRKVVKAFADAVVARPGIPWHMQSDVTFLDLVTSTDMGPVTADTGGKNIVAYVAALDPSRIHTDVHHHPGGFASRNYADVAKSIQDLGGNEAGVVGGFLVYPLAQSEVTAMLLAATQGMLATKSSFLWKPTILWGGGSPGHVMDLEASGIWRMKSATEVLVDDPAAPLPNIGPYNHIPEAFGAGLKDLIARAKAGTLPPGMYTATPVIDQCSLTDQNIGTYLGLVDEVAADTASGLVVWKDLYGMVDEWKSVYGSQPTIFQKP